jgi:hypothetical protein
MQITAVLEPQSFARYIPYILQGSPFLWFAGFLFFAVKTAADANKTYRLLRNKKIQVCGAYFSKGHSHIYLPPDFTTKYTAEEQEMLLAHEKQHIAQHDPFWYRLLPGIQCVFWFSPTIHKAVHLFQQDREMLCDERVTRNYSPRNYCHLLLKETAKIPIGRSVPGIVSETGGVLDRINAFLKPIRVSKKIGILLLLIMTVLFGLGFVGFLPVHYNGPTPHPKLKQAYIFLSDNDNYSVLFTPHIEGMEIFLLPQEDGIAIDQQGMYDYAIARGFDPQQRLTVLWVTSSRPVLLDGFSNTIDTEFAIEELLTKRIFLSYDNIENKITEIVFRFL